MPATRSASALLANGIHLVGALVQVPPPARHPQPRRGGAERAADRRPRRPAASIPTTAPPCVEAVDGLALASQNHWPSLGFDRRRRQRPALAAVRGRLLLQDLHVAALASGTGSTSRRSARRRASAARRPRPIPTATPPPRPLRRAGGRRRAGGTRRGAGGVRERRARDPRRRAGGDRRRAAARRDVDDRRQGGAGTGSPRRSPSSARGATSRCCRAPPRSATTITTTSGSLERVTDHLSAPHADLPRERLWQVRAREVVLATGAHERPLVFADNDRPGIMLAESLRAYVNRYGVRARPARRDRDQRRLGLHGGRRPARRQASRSRSSTCAPRRMRAGDATRFARRLRGPGRPHRRLARGGASASPAWSSRRSARRPRRPRRTLPRATASACRGGWTPAVHLFSQSRGKLALRRRHSMPSCPAPRCRPSARPAPRRGTYDLADLPRGGLGRRRRRGGAARARAASRRARRASGFQPAARPAGIRRIAPGCAPSSTSRTTSPPRTSGSPSARASSRSSTSSATPRPAWRPTRARPRT